MYFANILREKKEPWQCTGIQLVLYQKEESMKLNKDIIIKGKFMNGKETF
jgi:hypothetical protein